MKKEDVLKAEENPSKISSKPQTFHSALLKTPASVRHFTSAASDLSLEYVDSKINSHSSSTWFCGASLSKTGYLLSQQRSGALINVVLLELVLGDWRRKYQQSVKSCPGHSWDGNTCTMYIHGLAASSGTTQSHRKTELELLLPEKKWL